MNFMLEVDNNVPHVVFFTFNQPDEWDSPFNIYKPHSGFTLETQFLPNDINLYGEKAPSILKLVKCSIRKQVSVSKKK